MEAVTDERAPETPDGHATTSPRRTRWLRPKPGTQPGIDVSQLEAMPAWATPAPVTCIDYASERVEVRRIHDLGAFVESRRPAWVAVRWINVDGLDPAAIRALAIKYGLHPLAIEDLLVPGQRPKLESFAGSDGRDPLLFALVRMLQVKPGAVLENEQVGIFLSRNTVITFQETPGDIWDPIRKRLERPGSRMRTLDASYLLYALLDAIVDSWFPVLESYGDRLEALEEDVLARPEPDTFARVQRVKRELLVLRHAVWPMRDVVNQLQREPHECLSDTTRTYLRDVYDHTIQVMDIIETYREVASSLTENYMSSINNRLSEVMKVLTIIGTIFIPLTFLAGVYGMNMPIPENRWPGSYPMFWMMCLAVAGGMLVWFRKRHWL